jgi:AraC-like DNA-binding protein
MPLETDLDTAIRAAGFVAELFDRLPDVVFFAKDRLGRYAAVNDTLAQRLGRRRKEDVLGRTTRDLFPAPLGELYLEQDLAVCRSGVPLADVLELHLYPDGSEGWCLTYKTPVRSARDEVVGLVGISRDVRTVVADRDSLADLAEALRLVRESFGEPLRVDRLAAVAQLSVYRFGRRIRSLFGLTPAQLVAKTRIDAARTMLAGEDRSVAEIALACGYCDQSAFTRQFKRLVGLTPTQYRQRRHRGAPVGLAATPSGP